MGKNTRIARNTLLLYLRMIVTTVVSLYTVRLTLHILGDEDYGYFNLIAGIIGFTAIITATMTSATQRFLAFDLGKGDIRNYRRTYSMLFNVLLLFCVLAVVVLEIAAPLCLPHLKIAPERMEATMWLYQFTILNFIFATLSIPLTASLIAHERMDVYAYLMFVDVFFKLGIVYALLVTPFDQLVTLGALTSLMTLVIAILTWLYCRQRLPGCRYERIWDPQLFRRLANYAGWNLFGSVSSVLVVQGQTIILDVFFGPIVITAKAIADKIQSTVVSFSTNFYMAVSPQIVKSYASGDIGYMRQLVLGSSRYSYYLMLVLAIPLIYNMQDLLAAWLGESQVTRDMLLFAQLELVKSLVFVLENPITMAIRATGDIKRYQILVGIQTLLFLPLCYVAFRCGLPAYSSMAILAALLFIVQFTRVHLVRNVIGVTLGQYAVSVLLPLFVTTLSVVALHLLLRYFPSDGFLGVLLRLAVSFLLTAVCVAFIGLRKEERAFVAQGVRRKLLGRAHLFILLVGVSTMMMSCSEADDGSFVGQDLLPYGNTSMRILGIGNSFTVDATARLDEWIDSCGIDADSCCVYMLATSGAALRLWSERLDSMTVYKVKRAAGRLVMPVDSGTVADVLRQPWDVIVFQQSSNLAPFYSTYNPYLRHLIGAAKDLCANPDVRIGWQLTWSYVKGFRHMGGKEQWQQQVAATHSMMMNDGIRLLIPTGTAIQNVRQTRLCDSLELTRDSMHLAPLGRYVAAGVWYHSLLSPVLAESHAADGLQLSSDDAIIQQAIFNAVSHPFTITPQ